MNNIKTQKEIEIMRQGGKILSDVMWELIKNINAGISELDLDQMAEKLIIEKGGEPGFKRVNGYKHTICVSVNEVVVHGIPTENKLKEGDIIGIDCGVFYKGFNTDMSETVGVGKIDQNTKDFLIVGKTALNLAIKEAIIGNRVGNISKTIQEIVEAKGYSVVRSLVGHGIGHYLHEEPEIPGFLANKIEETPILINGMVIAIEAIYNMGSYELIFANNDGWTLKTEDGKLSGLFERTIAITNQGPLILTP